MLNSVEFSAAKISEGVWVALLNSSFLIASVECKEFKQAVFNSRFKQLSEDQYLEILAMTILRDWDAVLDPEGNELKYTPELGVIAFKTNEQVRNLVDNVSTDLSYFVE